MLKSETIKNSMMLKQTQIDKREALTRKLADKLKDEDNKYDKYEISNISNDVRISANKLDDLFNQLIRLNEQYKKQLNVENVPRIPAIEELLNKWEARYKEHIVDLLVEEIYQNEKLNKMYAELKGDKYNLKEEDTTIEYKMLLKKNRAFRMENEYEIRIGHDNKELTKFIAYSKENRRANLIQQVTKVVGEITDAEGLHFGYDSGINGLVVGKDGKARVETIDAGGYNIQCYHYRVLVKKV